MSEHPLCAKKRKKMTVVGWSALGFGVVAVPTPVIPGTIFFMLGLSLLSLESQFAHRQLARLRVRYPACVRTVEKMESWTRRVFSLTTHTREDVILPLQDGGVVEGRVEVSEIGNMPVVVVLHGAGGTKDSDEVGIITASFRRRGYTVVSFTARVADTSLGVTPGYYQTLVDVLVWARMQSWWSGSLVLAGHSVGGLVAGLYAQAFPADVDELVLVMPLVSEENYSLLNNARALSMKVRVLVGAKDTYSTSVLCTQFLDAIGKEQQVEIVSMDNVSHVPHTMAELRCLKTALA